MLKENNEKSCWSLYPITDDLIIFYISYINSIDDEYTILKQTTQIEDEYIKISNEQLQLKLNLIDNLQNGKFALDKLKLFGTQTNNSCANF